jgi:hypothetical protein
MPFVATIADVEARYGTLSEADSDLASVLVQDALTKLRGLRPSVPGLIDAADVAAAAVGATATQIQAAKDWNRLIRVAVAEAVIRVLVNAEQYRTTSIGADGSVSVGYTVATEVPRARLAFSGDDLADIDRKIRQTTGSGSVVTIGLTSLATEAETQTSTLPTP